MRSKLRFDANPVQARLLNSASRQVILNCTRQWGKSTVTAAKAVHHAATQPESLTLVVSPSARQSGEFVRKVARFVRGMGLKARGDGDNETSVALDNGSRVVGLPGSEATIRGFSAVGLLLVDEAARVEDELYKAVRQMLAVSNGALWLMSTPWGSRGFFYEAWTRGGPEWERVKVAATECPRIARPSFWGRSAGRWGSGYHLSNSLQANRFARGRTSVTRFASSGSQAQVISRNFRFTGSAVRVGGAHAPAITLAGWAILKARSRHA